jgi:hypothetical protein
VTDKIPFTWLKPKNVEMMKNLDRAVNDFTDATIELLELSGTGEEELVFGALAAYLKSLEEPGSERSTGRSITDRASALAAELASKGDLVDYGTALRCAWLTPAGAAWLADYDKWKEET